MTSSVTILFDQKWETPELIKEHASLAIDAVYNRLHLELDLTSDTLSLLDHQVGSAQAVDDAVLHLLSASTGAYFGELLRRTLEGVWHLPDPDSPLNWELRFLSCPFSLFPVAIAAEVIRKGPVSGVDASFCTAPSRFHLLNERLNHSPSITEETYYSFAGRLDAIALCVAFLTEVEQQLATATKSPFPRFGSESPLEATCLDLSLLKPQTPLP